MNSEIMDWLLVHYGQEQSSMNLSGTSLDRVKLALGENLETLQKKKIIIIAGTNGKGETTLRLSNLLKDESHVTWTSPHILRITERLRDEKGEISEEVLKVFLEKTHADLVQKKLNLSFYEFLFVVFCHWCSEKNPDYLLLEVGLGGRLDAVNVFDADLVLLPSISRDHQEFLGNRYDLILKEKLGTLRAKTFLIHFLENQYLIERAEDFAMTIGARVRSLKNEIQIPASDFSLRNETLARAAYGFLKNIPFVMPKGENLSFLENRGETLGWEGHECVFFGSHNVDGLRKLIQFLHSGTYNFSRPPYDTVIVTFSRRSGDDLKVMLKMLKNAALGKIVVTTFNHPKAAPEILMEEMSAEEGLPFVKNIESYFMGLNPNQRVLVTGSYYFIGHIKSLIGI
jgi:dihydrofolate synthase/folylpolyglutamate synthase